MVSYVSIEDRDLANQHFDRGISFDMRGKIDDAVKEMEKAVSLDPEFAEAFNKLGDFMMKKGSMSKAIDMYKKSAELKPEIENTHFDLGCAYAHLGKYSEALYELQKALTLDPAHSEIYGKMGFVYLKMDMLNEAVQNLKKALAKDPEDLMARFTLGETLTRSGDREGARQHFAKVIEKYEGLVRFKDRYAEGHYFIGRAYYFMERYDDAVNNMQKAVEYDTEAVDYHFSFGMLYSDADAFFGLAEAQAAQGSLEDARTNIQKALRLEPQNERFIEFQRRNG